MQSTPSKLGVVVVAFNSGAVIGECLESLFGADAAGRLAVVVVDNASTDETRAIVEGWASGARPFVAGKTCPVALRSVPKPVAIDIRAVGETKPSTAPLTLLTSAVNGGFAYGVNRGLEWLAARDDVAGFWVLNPDSVVPPHTPARYLARIDAAPFGMLSSRCIYYERPDTVQTDGGFVNRMNGVCSAANIGKPVAGTPLPDASALDFLTGANTVVSRAFLDAVGPMPEDYFLYYEEVDWAFRRGGFALELVADAEIYHHGGTSIGSGAAHRRATAFANYFNHRNRIRFVGRHLGSARATALGWTFAKAAQIALEGGRKEACAILAGALGMKPPREVSSRIADPAARAFAFGEQA
ncbi:MAG: glycosyltransferase family 2 protein [Proteobacteria bacterium]|nr:glycosyltransferase family 2 protein [Pseudomonadota bacterium]